MRKDYRTKEAQAYRRWYSTKAWRVRRELQLSGHPWCAFCDAMGLVKAATVADHVVPHRGDRDLFFNGELQSLCKTHHDSAKQSEERIGYSAACDADGYPLDPKHPANKPRG